ncbi:post-transcriptional regulator [Ectobacillus funiculus]|uniref:post-transcriptional regulator n=1 Tax=Ectobacillus funiculus TaxID=137993 RepID=UPI00397E1455
MTDKEVGIDAYRQELNVVLQSKLEEFHMLGYDRVTEQEIWTCLKNKKWKKLTEEIKIHQLVNDVLTLSTSDYMTYLTMQAYKAPLSSFEEYENK